MFKQLKNLFTKNNHQTESSEKPVYESSIAYSCNEDGEIFVDIDIQDYNEETISNFAKILCGISSFKFHIETLNIIKNGFIENGREELFTVLLEEILRISKDEIYSQHESGKKDNDEPCINPSDML